MRRAIVDLADGKFRVIVNVLETNVHYGTLQVWLATPDNFGLLLHAFPQGQWKEVREEIVPDQTVAAMTILVSSQVAAFLIGVVAGLLTFCAVFSHPRCERRGVLTDRERELLAVELARTNRMDIR